MSCVLDTCENEEGEQIEYHEKYFDMLKLVVKKCLTQGMLYCCFKWR